MRQLHVEHAEGGRLGVKWAVDPKARSLLFNGTEEDLRFGDTHGKTFKIEIGY